MARTGENIYKRKDGRWEGRFIQTHGVNSKAKYGYVYAKTYSEVRQKLAEKRCGIAISPSAVEMRQGRKYADILNEWLQFTRINIKESSYSKYSQIVDTHIIPILGEYPVGLISTQLI